MAAVHNYTSRKIVAFGWHKKGGFSKNVFIEPGNQALVEVPVIDNTGQLMTETVIDCYHVPSGKNADGYQLAEEKPLEVYCKENPDFGVTIRFFEEFH